MGYLDEAAELRYNKWSEREPLIAPEGENLDSRAKRVASYYGLSEAVKSFWETRAITGCQGLEFVAFSNAKLVRAVRLPNEVILYPCFVEGGGDLSDPVVQASMRMHKVGKHIYDGWLPIDSADEPGAVAARVEDLRESLASFALVSGSLFEWEPKYFASVQGSEIHYLGEDEIGTLEDIAEALDHVPEGDGRAILRSISWLARAKAVQDDSSKFLFSVLAIESLCTYIERESGDSSPLRKLAGPKLTKAERRKQRENGIRELIAERLDANPTKAVQDAYFTWVVPIKRMLRSHLEGAMGKDDEGVVLFFDGEPALYDIRHLIAHGGMSNVCESDLLRVSQNVWKVERFAARYVWRILNACLDLFNRSSKLNASVGMGFQDAVLGNRNMYKGPTNMALVYLNRI